MANSLPHSNTEIHSAPVMNDRIFLVAPKSMPQVQALYSMDNDFFHPCPLMSLPFKHCHGITGKSNHVLYKKTKQIVEAYSLQPLSFIETFNTDNCLRMVDAGYGIAFISQLYIKTGPSLNNSAFFTVDSDLFDCTRVIYYRGEKIPSYQQALIDTARKVCARLFLNEIK